MFPLNELLKINERNYLLLLVALNKNSHSTLIQMAIYPVVLVNAFLYIS